MKEKNLVIGERYFVKDGTQSFDNEYGFASFFGGKVGTLVENDLMTTHNLKVVFDGGDYDWGNAKGLRKLKKGEK